MPFGRLSETPEGVRSNSNEVSSAPILRSLLPGRWHALKVPHLGEQPRESVSIELAPVLEIRQVP